MKNSLVCCYLTHNHPDIVLSVLEHSLKIYADHGIDVCIYDDSDDDTTKTIVDGFVERGATNLYYIDAREAEGGDQKLYLIMNGYRLPKDYDYIWPVKDRVCFESTYIDRLCAKIDEDHDVILGLNEWQRWDVSHPVHSDHYTDPAEFYNDYGFFITNWECTIRKRSTMLDPVDWQKYKEIYNIYVSPFSQMLSLFARAAKMNEFSAAICRYDANERFFAAGGHSSWRNRIFDLWIDKWIDANYKLPNIYDAYKLSVIKDETNLKDIFGSVSYMMGYRDDGIYDRSVFEKYRNVWPLVTDIPLESLELIADMKYEEVIKKTINEFESSITENDFLKARYLFVGNLWFKQMYDEKTYKKLFDSFSQYTYDMLSEGSSKVFEGVKSVDDIAAQGLTFS